MRSGGRSGLNRTAPPASLSQALQNLQLNEAAPSANEQSCFGDGGIRMPPLPNTELQRFPSPLRQPHALRDTWTFWYRVCSLGALWQSSQRQAVSVDTVEDFWSAVNSLQPVGTLGNGTDCSFFKAHIQPMWEDSSCMNGGRWVIALERPYREHLQQLWQSLLMILIGGEFEEIYGNFICGAVVSVRVRGDRLAVWTSEVGSDRVNALKNEIIVRTGLPPDTCAYFEQFNTPCNNER